MTRKWEFSRTKCNEKFFHVEDLTIMFKYDLHHEMKVAARLKLSDEYGNAVDYLVG